MTTAKIIGVLLVIVTSVSFAVEIGKAAPDFALQTLKQEKISLANLKGKVVYLDFWASWCIPCRSTFPSMNELQSKYKNEGLEIVAISIDDDVQDVETFLAKIPAKFKILHDPIGAAKQAYGVRGVPASFVIDRQGVVRHGHLGVGGGHAAQVEEDIREVLRAK
jgi:cytochrome c biogenesis protein CcmG, thiol:disulfide interchange protein DsbE